MSQQKQKIHMNPELKLLDLVRAVKTLLWVDDALSPENHMIVSMAEDLGVRVVLATSTVEALERFEALGETKHFPQSHLRIISDMTRVEDGSVNANAGLDFAQELRKRKYLGPIMVFCGNVERSKQAMAEEHLVTITDDFVAAMEFACFQQKSLSTLYPDFEALRRENIEMRNAVKPGQSDVLYSKYYIDPTKVRPGDTTEAARILFQVEDLLFRYIDPLKTPRVKRIIVIDNPALRARFDGALRELDATDPGPWGDDPLLENLRRALPDTPYRKALPVLLWHCTSDTSEQAICCNGYQLGEVGKSTKNDGWYGRGLYFTSIPTYASHYAHVRTAVHKAGGLCITLNWVLTGRPFLMQKIDVGRAREPGYTTHYAVTHNTRPIQESAKKVGGGYARNMDGDELVVFDERHALPQYIIELESEY